MRTVSVLSLFAAFAIALAPACRSTSSWQEENVPSSPSTATSGSSAPSPAAARTAPASKPASGAARPTSQPTAPTPNRDKHGQPDVARYIENLQSEARVTEHKVEVVLARLALPDDAVVGDLGCGPGIFTLPFARACPAGVVFASDIEPAQLDVVRERIRETNLRNIVPILASQDDAHFPPGMLDVVFVADTYHHLEDRVDYMKRLAKALKPGGRLVILDYKPGPLKIGPPPEHKLAAGVMRRELIEAGWKLVETFDTHPYHDFEVWRLVQPWER